VAQELNSRQPAEGDGPHHLAEGRLLRCNRLLSEPPSQLVIYLSHRPADMGGMHGPHQLFHPRLDALVGIRRHFPSLPSAARYRTLAA